MDTNSKASVDYDVGTDRLVFSNSAMDEGVLRPLSFCYEITNACHFSCEFCLVSNHKQQPDRSVSFAIIQALTSEGPVRIGFSGGEPLLLDYTYDVAAYAKQLRAATLLRTTGTKTIDISRLQRSFDWVDISVDGIEEEMFARMRGKKGLNIIIEQVRLLVAANVRVRFNCILSHVNRSQVLAILRFAKNLGVQQVRYLPFIRRGEAKAPEIFNKHAYSPPELKEAINDIKIAAIEVGIPVSIIETVKEEAIFIVKPDGDIYYPAGESLVCLGNVLHQRFEQIFSVPLLTRHCESYIKHNRLVNNGEL